MKNKGAFYAATAYLIWGFFPIYFKLVHSASPLEILAHRVVWSLGFLAGLLALTGDWGWLRPALHQRRTLAIYLGASLLLGLNWFIYIWAVNHDYIIESSLGYFINPLVNVMLGVVLLRERLRLGQWLPVGIATVGVLVITLNYGHLPWIALGLALTFGLYGLMKKIAPLPATHGLTLETAFLFLPALGYLVALERQGQAAFAAQGWGVSILLALAGVITALPLLLFSSGARAIPMYLLGMLQYTAPTLQFLIGVFLYHEPFTLDKLLGFGIIWAALLLYTGEGMAKKGMESRMPGMGNEGNRQRKESSG